MELHAIIGLTGVALMLLAYAGVVSGRMDKDSVVMHGLNLSGSLMVIYSLVHDMNMPTMVVEVAWSSVAVFGLFKAFTKKA